jgi:hypothetical protein
MLTMLASLAISAAAPQPIEVMVVGTYHMGNPGRDLHNVAADDVTTPKRQAELEAVAAALATFRPTKVMVERRSTAPDLADEKYGSFSPADLATSRDERVQIGYRLAHRLHLPAVQAIDEQPEAGEPDYFPYDRVQKFADRHGRSATLKAANETIATFIADFTKRQATESIASLLSIMNDPASPTVGQGFYYAILDIGDNQDQPGADLNAGWYLRNAKIFAKLMSQAKPGDRVVVVYGSGHGYWLRHFAETTPGYRSVDPLPYLRAAVAR